MATATLETTGLDFRRSRWEYFSPEKPLDLLTMLSLAAPEWTKVVKLLDELQNPRDYRTTRALTNGDRGDLFECLKLILKYCDALDMEHTVSYIREIIVRVGIQSAGRQAPVPNFEDLYTPKEFAQDMAILAKRFEDELRLRIFFTLTPIRMGYYRKSELFGELVAEKFPGASLDVEEAGNCYALDRLTACIFHLMRVVERGLLALAKDLKITVTNENWGRILNAIEAKIAVFEKLPLKEYPTKMEDLQFYSEAAKEFRYFKNAWRNHVMHQNYMILEPEEVLKVIDHVRDFMQHISKRLSENP
jgi:hypothetical protein